MEESHFGSKKPSVPACPQAVDHRLRRKMVPPERAQVWTEKGYLKFPALLSLNCKSVLLSPSLQKNLLKDYRFIYHRGASEARECNLQVGDGKGIPAS